LLAVTLKSQSSPKTKMTKDWPVMGQAIRLPARKRKLYWAGEPPAPPRARIPLSKFLCETGDFSYYRHSRNKRRAAARLTCPRILPYCFSHRGALGGIRWAGTGDWPTAVVTLSGEECRGTARENLPAAPQSTSGCPGRIGTRSNSNLKEH
jgi:hypothetical protein